MKVSAGNSNVRTFIVFFTYYSQLIIFQLVFFSPTLSLCSVISVHSADKLPTKKSKITKSIVSPIAPYFLPSFQNSSCLLILLAYKSWREQTTTITFAGGSHKFEKYWGVAGPFFFARCHVLWIADGNFRFCHKNIENFRTFINKLTEFYSLIQE